MVGDRAILINVSAGELIDKVTILEIKTERFHDGEKLRHVRQELAMLKTVRDQVIKLSPQMVELTAELKSVNVELWRIEDEIRLCEQKKNFGSQFIDLARSVYRTNDRRSALKRRIDELVGSDFTEEKSYVPNG